MSSRRVVTEASFVNVYVDGVEGRSVDGKERKASYCG